MRDTDQKVRADLFFEVVDPQHHGIAKFAKLHGWTVQRVSNWRRRGIPYAALPQVAAWMGISVEDYLAKMQDTLTFHAREDRATYNATRLWRDYQTLDDTSRQIVDDIFERARRKKTQAVE